MLKPMKRAVAVVMISTALAACNQQTTEELIDSAEQYIQQDNFDAAIIELKNAISASPSDPKPRILISNIYLKQGELLAAEKELNRALDNGADATEILPKLAYALYHSEQFEAVIDLAGRAENLQAEALSDLSLFQFLSSLQVVDDLKAKNEPELLERIQGDDKTLALAYQSFYNQQAEQSRQTLSGYKSSDRPAITAFLKGALAFQDAEFVQAAEHFQSIKQEIPFLNSINFRIVEIGRASCRERVYAPV